MWYHPTKKSSSHGTTTVITSSATFTLLQFLLIQLSYVIITSSVVDSFIIIKQQQKQHCQNFILPFHSNANLPTSTLFKYYSSKKFILLKKSHDDNNNERNINKEVNEFYHHMQESLLLSHSTKNDDNDNFQSFVLRYEKPSSSVVVEGEEDILYSNIKMIVGRLILLNKNEKKNKRKKKNSSNNNNEENIYLQLTFKYYGKTDIVKNYSIKEENNEINDVLQYLILSKSSNNNKLKEGEFISSILKYKLKLNKNRKYKLSKTKIAIEKNESTANTTTIQNHDRTKKHLLSVTNTNTTFFEKLGIINPNTKQIKYNKISKYKQCQKFIEIIQSTIQSSNFISSEKNKKDNISIMDMGCGRGYLTFSVHSYLSSIYNKNNQDNININTVGIEMKNDLVIQTNTIANELGKPFDTLSFIQGTIEDQLQLLLSDKEDKNKNTDILIALHACNTATDDALYYGIKNKIPIIITSPCCHKELRTQINSSVQNSNAQNILHTTILQYGIYRERISEYVTDTLRSLLLQYVGYKVNIFEFISNEHTSKNIIMTAVLDNNNNKNKDNKEKIKQDIINLCSLFGVSNHKLASLMGLENELLCSKNEEGNNDSNSSDYNENYSIRKNKRKKSVRKMPAL